MADYDHVVSVVGNLYTRTEIPANCTSKFLDNIAEWKLCSVLKSGSLQDLVGHTHTCLGSAKHRIEGLLLLEKIINQSNTEVFLKNAHSWMNLLLQVLQAHSPAAHRDVTCHVISCLVTESKSLPELAREVSTSFLPQLLPLLLGASEEWVPSSIGCINVCIKLYPGACGVFKGKIETFILPYLDREYPVEDAVRCFAVLAGCGGSGNLGVKHTEGWSRQCQRALVSLWAVLAQLYADLDQNIPGQKESGLPLRPILVSEPQRSSCLQARYKMLSHCLSYLLREEFSATVKVPVPDILTLICRTLSVNNKMLLSKQTTQRLVLAYVIPGVHKSALRLLAALILCTKRILVAFSSSVIQQLTQTLQWTHVDSYTVGMEKPYSHLRETVYAVTCDWLKTVGGCCDLGSLGSEFIQELLSDIRAEQTELKIDSSKLNKNNTDGPSSSKKRKKGAGYQEISQGQGLAKRINKTANHSTCSMALEALRWLLHTNGTCVKTKAMKEMVQCLMQVSTHIQQCADSPPLPYAHPGCRVGMYRAVLALVLVPHPTCPPPIHLALRLLQKGLQDPDIQVSSCCREALIIMEVIVHPRAPCLQPVVKITDPPILIGESMTPPGQMGGGKNVESYSMIFQHDNDQPHYDILETNSRDSLRKNGDLNFLADSSNRPHHTDMPHETLPISAKTVKQSVRTPHENEMQVQTRASTSSSGSHLDNIPAISPGSLANQMDCNIHFERTSLIDQKKVDSRAVTSPVAMATDKPCTVEAYTVDAEVEIMDAVLLVHSTKKTESKTEVESKASSADDEQKSPLASKSDFNKSEDLEDMLSSFVDASPDRDSEND